MAVDVEKMASAARKRDATLPGVLSATQSAIERTASYPRLRYMGSKYRLIPRLVEVFGQLGGRRALDAFSGSGVVAYALKTLGFAVTANDFLAFPIAIAGATVANQTERLTDDEISMICGPSRDGRSFIQHTFDGLYFTPDDREFLDAAWSHVDHLPGRKRDLAIAALVLAAARKQPRGVFTVVDLRYDDGRRMLREPLRQQFEDAAHQYNSVVFDNARPCRAQQSDVFDMDPGEYDLVYLDPPYAPPRDDNCYIKRYHFLEGLSVYWRGQTIRADTKTKKLEKRFTPFSYKHTVTDALERTIRHFSRSKIVLSYSSNAIPDVDTIEDIFRKAERRVEVVRMDHTYTFGTHARAKRREATEYLFVAA